MITINDIEILTVQEGLTWAGSKDEVARTLTFSFLYAPEDNNIPVYKAKCGDKVRWTENNKTLFYGYVSNIDYDTDGDIVNVTCIDLSIRLLKSKCIGRFKGTIDELANRVCSACNLISGFNTGNNHIHNIVSEGDLSYYDIINTACKTLYERYCIFLDGLTLKLVPHDVKAQLKIKDNIRSSGFSSNIDDVVNSVLVIDNDGKLLDTIRDNASIERFGLFQTVYNYNKDCKDNKMEAKKMLKGVENKAQVVVNNDNNVISGCFVSIYEPTNGFEGVFEVLSDSHNIGIDNYMSLEVKKVE